MITLTLVLSLFLATSGVAFGQLLEQSQNWVPKEVAHYANNDPLEATEVGRVAKTGYIIIPVATGNSISTDATGGFFHYDSSGVYHWKDGKSEVVVDRKAEFLGSGALARGFTGSMQPWLASEGGKVLFPVSSPSVKFQAWGLQTSVGADKKIQLDFGTRVKFLNAGKTVEGYFFHAVIVRGGVKGGAVYGAFISPDNNTASFAQYIVGQDGVFRPIYVAEGGASYAGSLTQKYAWLAIRDTNRVWRYRRVNLATGQVLEGFISKFEPMDPNGDGGVYTNASSAALVYRDELGKYRFVKVPDGTLTVPVPAPLLKGDAQNVAGFPLDTSGPHIYDEGGNLTFFMRTSGGTALLQITGAGDGRLIADPTELPACAASKLVESSGNIFLMCAPDSIGSSSRVYQVVRPALLTKENIPGKIGEEVAIPCSGCSGSNTLTYTVKVSGKIVSAKADYKSVKFVVPELDSGVHDVTVEIRGSNSIVSLVAKLEIVKPAVILPRLNMITELSDVRDRDPISVVAPGKVVKIIGLNCHQQDVKSLGGRIISVFPLPASEAGCRVRMRNLGSTQWLTAPTLGVLYLGEVFNTFIQIPFGLEVGQAEIILERLGGSGVEAVSRPTPVVVKATAPSFHKLRDDPNTGEMLGENAQYPIQIWNATKNAFVFHDKPVEAGDILVVYFSGGGRTNPSLPDGSVGVAEMSAPVKVTLGGHEAEVLFAGTNGGGVGEYQLNFRISKETVIDEAWATLILDIGGEKSSFDINVYAPAPPREQGE